MSTKQKYPTYKPSNIDWIGDIPEGREMRKLWTIGNFSASGIDKKIIEGEPMVKIINYTDIYANGSHLLDSKREYMSVSCSVEKKEKHQVKKGDLIFTPSSETIEDIGVSALVSEDIQGTAFSYHVLRFQFDKEMDDLYKKYLCNNNLVLSYFSSCAKGTTRQVLSRTDFRGALVVIPPLKEQQAIANYLDIQTSRIDEAVSLKQKQIELLKEKRTALINHAVTKGLDPNVEMVDSGIEWIGMIPKGWEARKIRRLFDIIGSGGTPKSGNSEYYHEGEIKRLNTGDLNDGEINDIPKSITQQALVDMSSIKVYPKGSLVIAMYGATIGKLGILGINASTNQACCVLNKPNNIEIRFMYYRMLAMRKEIINLGYGGGQPNISQDTIKQIRVPLPSVNEQLTIIDYIENNIKTIDEATSAISYSVDLLQEYKKSLIGQTVTGKVKVF